VLAAATLINVAFAAAEAMAGWWANSVALIADAGHNLSDVIGLALAWLAASMARRIPTSRYTWGFRSGSILAALANAVLLMVAAGAIGWEAVRRLSVPQDANVPVVLVVALIGVVVNAFTAGLLHRGQHYDLNVRGAYLHMLADAAVSAAVVAGALTLWATGWRWIDPAIALAVVAAIVYATWDLFRESLRLALHAVPANVDVDGIRRYLGSLPGVAAVHDLHVWGMSTTDTALSAHLVRPEGHPGDRFLAEVSATLAARFGVHHATLQIEIGDPEHPCSLEPDHVV
jgi:cobalt-zinc-cadmium efflux system protein